MNLFQRIGLAFITGYIWFFTGERIFWSFFRPGDNPIELILGWVVYSLVAYICLILISSFKIRSIAALFLIGAFFGWTIEGVYSLTLFGAEGIPFPLTISWTALAWHSLGIVLVWYGMRKMIMHSVSRTIVGSVALGLFWGVWALAWPLETPPVNTGVILFLLHGVLFTVLYIFALHAYAWIPHKTFDATRAEKITLGLIVLLYFGAVTVPTAPLLALTVLPSLFALIYWGIHKNSLLETRLSVLEIFAEPISWKRSFILLLSPCVATLIFASRIYFPSNSLFFVILTPVGGVAFIWALFSIIYKERKASKILIQMSTKN